MEVNKLRIGNKATITKQMAEELWDTCGLGLENLIVTISGINDDQIDAWIDTIDENKKISSEIIDFAPNELKPITLTRDWLEKFGFSDKDYKKGYIGIDVKNFDFPLCKPKVLGEFQKHFAFKYEVGSLPLFKELKYVHQLQNLFHSLFEEELKLQ